MADNTEHDQQDFEQTKSDIIRRFEATYQSQQEPSAEMTTRPDSATMLALAEEIFGQTYFLDKYMKQNSIAEPTLAVGASTELWTSHSKEITKAQTSIFGLTKQLTKLLFGPHGFLHEYISTNWEYGALYTVLEFNILEKIPIDGEAHVSQLAAESGLPEDKLLRILRLISCEKILEEVSEQVFRHTALSEELVKDKKFKAFIGFQLFETRVASVHLADSLKEANDYQCGQSAFKHAWGASLYDWHKAHPEKNARFNMAMEGVIQSLDPGNALFCDWFARHQSKDRNLIKFLGARDGCVYMYLAEQFPALHFEVQDPSEALLTLGKNTLPAALAPRITYTQRELSTPQPASEDSSRILAFALRNVLWNMSDAAAVTLLRSFIPTLEKSPATVILVNDGMSPGRGMFDRETEKAYRRRDVTVMTMHNAKQRTEAEWRDLFAKASPHFCVEEVRTKHTSHAFRGLWEVRWVLAN